MTRIPMQISRFRADDVTAVAALYGRAVRIGARQAYPRKALLAWARPRLSMRFFRNRMLPTWTFVATVPGGGATRQRFPGAGQGGSLGHGGEVVLGFAEIMQDGHVRMLFTDPAATRSGIASRLLVHALDHARSHGITSFTTDASRLSRPVFARAGFRPMGHRLRAVAGARLLTTRMVLRPGRHAV
ncbi:MULTISPECIES: GNAT family N-acetyltransferase [unclassified Minwuia]|jgi:putative acetyltransferase|uniref:GNAT family N-acetyltransferase n=1 Tax=unclassified Minwuia TaxID=2618799 RepID=UPI002479F8B1|nr:MULTISPECIES: GNAT family N-acetyltransferase [unclassified Minwuia]